MNNSKMFIFVLLVLVAGVGIYFYRHSKHCCSAHQATTVAVAPKTIFAFLGAPGSGKGTLAKEVVKELQFVSVSTGDLCRAEATSGSEKGKMIAQCMQGGLVPDDVMTEMVDVWLAKNAGNAPIVLDGYPRTKAQAEKLAELLHTKFADYAFSVIYLNVTDEEEVVKRLAGRLVCEQCKAIYNSEQLKDVAEQFCEKCKGKLIRREDDKEEVIRERMKTFAQNNNAIIEYYKSAGIPVKELVVSRRTPQEIFADFKQMVSVVEAKEETPAATPAEAPVASQIDVATPATEEAQQEVVAEEQPSEAQPEASAPTVQ